jgi:hypothetical protein
LAGAFEYVKITFLDSIQGKILLRRMSTDATGVVSTQVTIPGDATPGKQHVKVTGATSGQIGTRRFVVT